MTGLCAHGLVEGVRLFVEAAAKLDVMAPESYPDPTEDRRRRPLANHASDRERA